MKQMKTVQGYIKIENIEECRKRLSKCCCVWKLQCKYAEFDECWRRFVQQGLEKFELQSVKQNRREDSALAIGKEFRNRGSVLNIISFVS